MPYKLKKSNDGSFRLVNTETGHILAEHTTPERASKQIKAIHAHRGNIANRYVKPKKNKMPANHAIRKKIEILQGRSIHNPTHRKFVDMTKKLLKHEEIHGSGFWDDAWDFTKDVLAFPRDIIENTPFVKTALDMGLTAILGPEGPALLEAGLYTNKLLFGEDTNRSYKETWNPSSLQNKPYVFNKLPPLPPAESNAATSNVYQGSIGDVVNDTLDDVMQNSTNQKYVPKTAREQILDPFSGEKPTQYNALQHLIPSSNLAFPPTLNFDPREQPMSLVRFLESQAISGLSVSDAEYNSIVLKQKPQLWLSFPDNGYFKKYPTSQTSIN